jgi:hypothetical protein
MGICQPKPKRDSDEIEGVVAPIRKTPGTDFPKTTTEEEANPFQKAEEQKLEDKMADEADHSEVAAEENPEEQPITMRKSTPLKQPVTAAQEEPAPKEMEMHVQEERKEEV